MKVQDILDTFDFTMDEFWEIVDTLPDDDENKKRKKNINAYFKKDGTLKAKALSLSTQNDYQTMHDTQGFIRRYVRDAIHMNRLKRRRQDKLDNRGLVRRRQEELEDENGQNATSD